MNHIKMSLMTIKHLGMLVVLVPIAVIKCMFGNCPKTKEEEIT